MSEDLIDDWKRIWYLQSNQQFELGLDPKEMDEVRKLETANQLALGLYEEASELVRCSSHFKKHILRNSIDRENIREEAVDVIKYLLSIIQLHGITPDEFIDAFHRKTIQVRDKARGERLRLQENTKVILIDLDGCIAETKSFDETLEGLSIQEKEARKSEFRRKGGYASLPLINGALDTLQYLKFMLEYKIVIITSRPHKQFKRIYGDTLVWLDKYKVPFDLILFRRDKAEAISEYIFPARPLCFIEDRAKHALEVVDLSVPVILFDNEGNRMVDHPLIHRVLNWKEALEKINKLEREGP